MSQRQSKKVATATIKSQYNINNIPEDNVLYILSLLSYHDLYALYTALFNTTSHTILYTILHTFLQSYTIDKFKIVQHNSHSLNIEQHLNYIYNKLKWILLLNIKVNKLSIDIDYDDYDYDNSDHSILLNNIATLIFMIPYKYIYICSGIVIDELIEIILLNLTHALNNSALRNTLLELHMSNIPKIEEDYFNKWPILNNLQKIKMTKCIVPFDCSISDLLTRIPNAEYIYISNRTQLNWHNIIYNNIILPQLKQLTLENAIIDTDLLIQNYCPNLIKLILIDTRIENNIMPAIISYLQISGINIVERYFINELFYDILLNEIPNFHIVA